MSKELRKEVDKGISTICKAIGFKKKQYDYVKLLDDNVTATLSFGMTSYKVKGHIFVDVIVGVSHRNLEQLYADLTDIDKSIVKHTISEQIGYTMPQNIYIEWDFIENADNTHVFEDLFKSIQTYGFIYQEKMKDFDNLFEAFDKRASGVINYGRDRYLPILYYLKGNKEQGMKIIEEAIERMSKCLTDEEIRNGKKPEDVIILRAGESPKMTGDEMEKALNKLRPGGEMIIVGGGEVDPSYLEFVERYKYLT